MFLLGLQQLVGLARSNTRKGDGDIALRFLLVRKSACFLLSLTSQNLRENSSRVEVPQHGPKGTEKPERPNCWANSSPGCRAHWGGNLYSPSGGVKATCSELQ